jgi:hypothetical protein
MTTQPPDTAGTAADTAGTAADTAGTAADTAGTAPVEHPHDFEVQKQVHQQIRNDPDYDDWEYGTEPLPREAWLSPDPGSRSGSPQPGV